MSDDLHNLINYVIDPVSLPLEDEILPVLVIGGGPVGCAMALDLAQRGHPPLVIEPEAAIPTAHPRGANISMRTVEHYRRWGISEELKSCATWVTRGNGERYVHGKGTRTVFADALLGHELGAFPFNYGRTEDQYRHIAAEPSVSVIQPYGHALMRRRAHQLGARFVFGWRLVDLLEEAGAVVATLEQEGTGARHILRSRYLVGADGAQSQTRKLSGNRLEGEAGGQSTACIVTLKAGNNTPIIDRMRYPIDGYLLIANKALFSNFAPFNETQWRFTIKRQEGETPATPEEVVKAAHALFGEEIPVEVTSLTTYRTHIRIAESFSRGRVFLIGDAAHLFPPTGGQNQNQGIGDAVNLAWKLSAVLDGWAPEKLLVTYDLERRPAAWRTGRVAYGIAASWGELSGLAHDIDLQNGTAAEIAARRHELAEALYRGTFAEWNTNGIVLDIRYDDSPIILRTGVEDHAEWDNTTYLPHAAAGHRAPHSMLPDGSALYDHFGAGFILLLRGNKDAADAHTFEKAAADAGLPLTLLSVDVPSIRDLYGFDYVLIRPDQQIAWVGSDASDAADILAVASGHRVEGGLR